MESTEVRSDGFLRAFFIGFGAGCLLFVVYMISLVLLGKVGLGAPEDAPLVSPAASELDKPPAPPTGYGGPGRSATGLPAAARTRVEKPTPPPKPQTRPQPQPAPAATPRTRAEDAYDEGLEHLAARRYGRAKSRFNNALGIDHSFAPAYKGLGLAYEKLGNKDMAQAAFSRYLSLSPDAPDADLVRQRIKNL